MDEKKTGIAVSVIDWKNGTPAQVAITYHEFDQMLTIDSQGARTLAFALMECADFIDPPFDSPPLQITSEPGWDEQSMFGPYDENPEMDDSDDNEDD